ncbi:MAG: stage II sporulation protein M [Candidatus Syntrophonatronum acetioxidans]|uniref:Stage II sporulation protein M n=1 Tax=Candidatus Syntrophonatronum acetioxidans TaxID=1795816 RepID=A0A424YHU1_9FIRM|nr:MAG: stage II sporulation protein M [Candidatus Syntrophonatronum acetioxidans]
MLNIKIFFKTLKQNNRWIILSALIFLVSFFLGYIAAEQNIEFIDELSEPYFEFLESMAQDIVEKSPGRGILLLFFNNLFASLRVIFLGIILGIPPLFGLIINGSILGVVTALLAEQNIAPLLFLTLGILPHGILELPAFLISAAFGLKLGYHFLFPIKEKTRWESLALVLKEIFSIILFITILLITAAAVEILITPLLLRPLSL